MQTADHTESVGWTSLPKAHLCRENIANDGYHNHDIDNQRHGLSDAAGIWHFQHNEDHGTNFLDFLYWRYEKSD